MKQSYFALFIIAIMVLSCTEKSKEQQKSSSISSTDKSETNMPETSLKNQASKAMHPQLVAYIEALMPEMAKIPQERKEELERIAAYVQAKSQAKEAANLTFICTHNSRRSHLSQIWAATAAAYYGIEGVNAYSGGTEATAFNPRAVAAIERAGFRVENPGGDNPRYQVTFSDNAPAMECFSKRYDDPTNASEDFVAVMTCSEADKNCPLIPGASLRVSIPYVDPKASDGTEKEAATYDERCKQIATEMCYIMSHVKA